MNIGFARKRAPSPLVFLIAALAVPVWAQDRNAAPAAAKDAPDLDRLSRTVAARLREVPDPADVRGMAARLGSDPHRLRDFVEKEVAFEPYAGVLRGAEGALLSRSGNSLDRALLLQQMVEASGWQTRLVRTQLPEDLALRLVNSYRASAAGRSPAPEAAGNQEERWRRVAESAGWDPGLFVSWQRERVRGEEALVRDVADAAARESRVLEDALGAAGLRPTPDAAAAGKLAAVAREHFWVQVRSANGQDWEDLDPAVAVLGDGGSRRAETSAAGSLTSLERTLRISLVLRRRAVGNKETPVKLLDLAFPLHSLGFRSIELTISPDRSRFPSLAQLSAMEPRARVDALQKAKVFRAEVLVDGQLFGGLPFDRDGLTYEVASDGRVAGAQDVSGGVAKGFGGLFGGDEGEEKPATAFGGLDLILDVKGPDARTDRYRRSLLPPAEAAMDRRPLPVLRWSLLVQTSPLSVGARHRMALQEMSRKIEDAKRLIEDGPLRARIETPREPPEVLLQFADYRSRALARVRANWAGRGVILQDRPVLAAATWQLHLDEKTGRAFLHQGIDIMENRVRAFPAGDSRDAWRAALELGVADTALEAFLVLPDRPGVTVASAWALLERRRLLGGAVTAAAGPEAIKLAGVQDMEPPGALAVTWGGAGTRSAFWAIDPETGSSVGRVPSGAGQAMLEYAANAREFIDTICNVSNLADMLIASDQDVQKKVETAKKAKDIVCGIVGGNLAVGVTSDQVSELTNGAYQRTAGALGGAE